MKKLLILMLVLGLASLANASLSYEVRESDMSTVVANSGDLAYSNTYYVVVSGNSDQAPVSGGLYGRTFTTADWQYVTPSDPCVLDTGNLSFINWSTSYKGYEWGVQDYQGPGVSTGDWVRVTLHPENYSSVWFAIDLYDYAVSSSVPVDTLDFHIIPEPTTIALLGLGGLLLTRRRK